MDFCDFTKAMSKNKISNFQITRRSHSLPVSDGSCLFFTGLQRKENSKELAIHHFLTYKQQETCVALVAVIFQWFSADVQRF